MHPNNKVFRLKEGSLGWAPLTEKKKSLLVRGTDWKKIHAISLRLSHQDLGVQDVDFCALWLPRGSMMPMFRFWWHLWQGKEESSQGVRTIIPAHVAAICWLVSWSKNNPYPTWPDWWRKSPFFISPLYVAHLQDLIDIRYADDCNRGWGAVWERVILYTNQSLQHCLLLFFSFSDFLPLSFTCSDNKGQTTFPSLEFNCTTTRNTLWTFNFPSPR